MKSPILGASYVARSVNAADNRMVNLYPEATPDGGKEAAFLTRCPGLEFLQTIGTGPIRALWAHQTNGSDFYVVSGLEVYKVTGMTAVPTLTTVPKSFLPAILTATSTTKSPTYLLKSLTPISLVR